MSELTLYLFGEPRLEVNGHTVAPDRRKAFALLAYLALAENRQSRDVLAALLWPELDAVRARSALRSTLYSLGSLAPGAWIQRDHATLALDRTQVWNDVGTFLALIRQSRAHPHADGTRCDACRDWLEHAVELYGADFLHGFAIDAGAEFDDWQQTQAEWLRREYAQVLARLVTHYAAVQNAEQGIGYAQRWLALDALHEPAHRALMRVYVQSGQRAAALRQYQQCADLLWAELAIEPDEETAALHTLIQAERSTPVVAFAAASHAVAVLPPRPPLVIGREAALRALVERLSSGAYPSSILAIQGWPGVGKSTIVAALAHDPAVAAAFPDGVLWASLGETPALLGELRNWASALGVHDPGSEPTLEGLRGRLTALLRDRRVLLIVDDVWQVSHLAPFQIGGRHCALVMTSRLNDVAVAIAPTAQDIFRLPVLAESPALELLGRLTPETVAQHPNAARQLVRDLEGLPLAIQVAGRLLHSEAHLGWGVAELLADLRQGARLLATEVPSDLVQRDQVAAPTVAALLQRSTDALDPQTRQRFALLGLFVPKPASFTLPAMAIAWDVADARPTARVLVNRGLLEPSGNGRFQLHALLVLHARALLED